MALVDGKDNSLADQRLTLYPLGIDVAAIQNLGELAHDGSISLRDRKSPLKGGRIDDQGLPLTERLLEFASGFLSHRRPVELGALDLEAPFGGCLHRLRLVDLIGHEVSVSDGVLQLVGDGGRIDFEEPERVANEGIVIIVSAVVIAGLYAGRGGEADLYPVEVLEHAAPLPIDAAVALVADDQIEVPTGVVGVKVHHALQRSDRDALLVLETSARAQHVGRVVGQMLGEGILGLLGQRDAVHQKEHPRDRVGLEQALDEGGCGTRLAGACGHFHQQLSSAVGDLATERIDACDLIVALDDPAIDGDLPEVAAQRVGGCAALEIILLEEGLDHPGEGFALPIPEPDLVTVGQEYIGHTQVLCIGLGLSGGVSRADRESLGLDHRQ